MTADFSRYRTDDEIATIRDRLSETDPEAAEAISQLLHERGRNQASRRYHMSKARNLRDRLENGLADPDMPASAIRLIMGEMSAQEVRTARAAIRFANSLVPVA